jgi:hypothetical protein
MSDHLRHHHHDCGTLFGCGDEKEPRINRKKQIA